MKKLTFMFIIIVFCMASSSMAIEKVITVSGHGSISVDPNVAYLNFGVVATDALAMKAQSKNAEAMTKLISALNDAGIDNEKMQTSNYSMNPLTDYSAGKEPRITGYRCDSSVTVTIDNLENIGRLMDAGIAAGANTLNNLRFSVKDESKFKMMALERAVEDAKLKGRSIENATGLQIKKIYSVVEKGAEFSPVEMSRNVVAMSARPETPVLTGKLVVSADVEVNFEF